ncbi:Quinate/shikimate dehydrogenase [Pseudoruegeria aquimaris]|uniref:shikimate dehydrogenase (NADP(+)) n=1 Tax=Pseudoruegeria aquimaris TaxID=393663 RepID=A0A1Y5T6U2_9RHOB|nr:NAD(P)-binding domain-containing protein [Pseudoruegeria aquimaris]SLN53856.1 Quinate/shikimate dehydrogenase [Pseudoruegeria aquimaris]
MKTLRIGLIGDHIGDSRFGAAMQALCDLHALDLSFTPIDTAGDAGFSLHDTLERLQAEGWDGVSVTHPHKGAAADLAGSAVTEEVAAIGASNLVTFRPERLAHNTDAPGFRGAWHAAFGSAAPGQVAMAGAGGVARAVAAALVSLGAEEILVWDPEPERAKAFAASFGPSVKAIPFAGAADAIREADGLVNATPLGMGRDKRSAFSANLLGPQSWAFDAVYTPPDTPFLKDAAGRHLSILSGVALFRYMAIESFTIYSGLTPDEDAALEVLRPLAADFHPGRP